MELNIESLRKLTEENKKVVKNEKDVWLFFQRDKYKPIFEKIILKEIIKAVEAGSWDCTIYKIAERGEEGQELALDEIIQELTKKGFNCLLERCKRNWDDKGYYSYTLSIDWQKKKETEPEKKPSWFETIFTVLFYK